MVLDALTCNHLAPLGFKGLSVGKVTEILKVGTFLRHNVHVCENCWSVDAQESDSKD